MPATATDNTYATWDTGTSTYSTLEAASTYGILGGASLLITRTLSSSGAVTASRARQLVVGGSLASAGSFPKQASYRRSFAGTPGSSGVVLIGKIFTRSVAGTLGSNGALMRLRRRILVLTGMLPSSGLVSFRQLQRIFIQFDGVLRLQRSLRLHVERGPIPPLHTVQVPSTATPPLLTVGRVSIPSLLTVICDAPPALVARTGGTLRPLTPAVRRVPPPLRGDP